MSHVVVRSQAELDAALARTDLTYATDEIVIDAPRAAWLEVYNTRGLNVRASGSSAVNVYGTTGVHASDSASVRAYDSSTVTAYGSSTVTASDSATVHAYGYATVNAYGSSTVTASGSVTVAAYSSAEVTASDSVMVNASGSASVVAYDFAAVRARENATVRATDYATVRAYNSAEVTASGSAKVHAYDSSSVTATGSATVYASGLGTVRAYDSATVHASGSSTVHAGSHVAIHRRTARATVHGGTIIDRTNLDLNNPQMWADYTGAHVQDGEVVLYKAVDDTLTAGHAWTPTTYSIGQTVTCEDWRDDNDCGGGLHASPHPHQALSYYSNAERMVRVAAPLDSIRPIGTDKAKAPMFRVLDEVTLTGRPLTEAEAR